MTRSVIILVLSISIAITCAQNGSTSLDKLISSIFITNNGGVTSSTTESVIIQPTSSPDPFPNPIPNPNPDPNPVPVNPRQDKKPCKFNEDCVPRFLCNNGKINRDGTTLINIRSGVDTLCDSYLEVCCSISDTSTNTVVTIPQQPEGCGFQNPNGIGFKITGAENGESEFGEFPWMVAILREEKAGDEILNLYECGGAIIAPNVVLTAAHCVRTRTADTLLVRAGEWDTQTRNEILPHQDRRVDEIIVHEQFNKGALYNDIALLILNIPFVFQENVRPVCLPEHNTVFDSSRCYATGWGKDSFGKDGKYQVILKKISLPIVPHAKCQTDLRATRLSKYFDLHESFICAGGEKNIDTCKGDGGSPLVCPIPGQKARFYQAGIVAWGIGCGELNVPGVYGSVTHLRPWINEKLTSRGITFEHFTP